LRYTACLDKMTRVVTTRNLWRGTIAGASVLTIGVFLVASLSGSAAAAKKPKSCTILKASEIETVVGAPVSGPGEGGTLGIACDFDIGPGLGDSGGGLVILQVYSGTTAKGVWSAAQAGEKVGKVYWDAGAEIASGYKKPNMVAASVTYTGGTDSDVKGKSVALVNLMLKKLD
jgi:hypothetical protein